MYRSIGILEDYIAMLVIFMETVNNGYWQWKLSNLQKYG